MAGLTFDFAQTVAIGAFNPHIVTVDWLVTKTKIVPEEQAFPDTDDADSFSDFGDDDGAAGFLLAGFEWDVSLARLAVAAREPGKDCGALAAAVMKELHHTPVHAVGNNFAFFCSVDDWGGRPKPGLVDTRAPLGPVDQRWVGQYRGMKPGVEIEVDLLHSPLGVVLRLNYDRPADDSKAGQAAAGEFPADYRHATELIQQLFDIQVNK